MCELFEAVFGRLAAIERRLPPVTEPPAAPSEAVVGPHGALFATRLEAKWAFVFEELGWRWQYRPPPMNGYGATFLVPFSAANLWVDVVPGWPSEETRRMAAPVGFGELAKLGGLNAGWMRVGDSVEASSFSDDVMLVGGGGTPDTFFDGGDCDGLVMRLHVSEEGEEGEESWVIGGDVGTYDLDICDGDTGWKKTSADSGERFEEIWERAGEAAAAAPVWRERLGSGGKGSC